jgi:excisionase family DNA binding protein
MNANHKIEHVPDLKLAPATDQRPVARSSVLLTPEQLAERLSVPPSWVREKTRARARLRDKDPLPVVRLGKYVRFVSEDVDAWVARQGR